MPMPQEYFAASRDFDAFMADAKAALNKSASAALENNRAFKGPLPMIPHQPLHSTATTTTRKPHVLLDSQSEH